MHKNPFSDAEESHLWLQLDRARPAGVVPAVLVLWATAWETIASNIDEDEDETVSGVARDLAEHARQLGRATQCTDTDEIAHAVKWWGAIADAFLALAAPTEALRRRHCAEALVVVSELQRAATPLES